MHIEKAQKYPLSMATLPVDTIFTEIFPKLPAKTLLLCKCVCKLWHTLISSPEFIDLHLRHALASDTNSLLILTGDAHCLYSSNLDSSQSSCLKKVSFPKRHHVFVIGSCNGLLCMGAYYDYSPPGGFYFDKRFVIFFNPSTGMYKEIALADNSYGYYGFGFDCVSNDYKLVRITRHNNEDDNVVKREVMVYSLKADSWKKPKGISGLKGPLIVDIDGTLTDNHLVHWRVWSTLSEGHDIVCCFDLRNERWTVDVPLPSGLIPKNFVRDIGVLDKCLCLLTAKKEESNNPRVNVWVMKEYGVKESWVKLVALSNLVRPKSIYCKGSSDRFFIIERDYIKPAVFCDCRAPFGLLWYDVRTKQTKTVRFPVRILDSMAHICSGSLVTIPGATKLKL